jgi:homogentisate phytyltransferase/homogentisate geranylgeranyltransferase
VVLAFSSAIALLKDLRNGSNAIGGLTAAQVLNLVRWLLTICYSSVIIGALFIPAINAKFLMVTHGLALAYFCYLSCQVQPDAGETDATCLNYREYYQLIWKLFFIEYLIFPTSCLLY